MCQSEHDGVPRTPTEDVKNDMSLLSVYLVICIVTYFNLIVTDSSPVCPNVAHNMQKAELVAPDTKSAVYYVCFVRGMHFFTVNMPGSLSPLKPSNTRSPSVGLNFP